MQTPGPQPRPNDLETLGWGPAIYISQALWEILMLTQARELATNVFHLSPRTYSQPNLTRGCDLLMLMGEKCKKSDQLFLSPLLMLTAYSSSEA